MTSTGREELASKGIHYVDVGTSGGVFGLERGFCLMIGGEHEPVQHLDPIFKTIAPGVESASRTPGRSGEPSPAEQGYLHCGPAGAGHFVKMVHNGIEYGIMAAYAEGFNVLRHANVGKQDGGLGDAETAPLRDPRYYQYDFDVAQVAEVWRRGSVVASWLLDLTAAALAKSPDLEEFTGRVSDSGEGRWTIHAAVDDRRPRKRAVGCALRALQLARRGRLRGPAPVGAEIGVRRACREAGGLRCPRGDTAAARATGGAGSRRLRDRDLRSQRRPRAGASSCRACSISSRQA